MPVAGQVERHLVPDQDTDLFESEEVEPLKLEGVEPLSDKYVELARLEQLSNQQSQRFYDFAQHRVPTKLQTAFVAGAKIAKVHRRDLPPELVNYRELKGHPFEESFRTNMESHIQQHQNQFRS